jgi:hypothetical protein
MWLWLTLGVALGTVLGTALTLYTYKTMVRGGVDI